MSKRYDELPNDVEELKKMQSDLKAQVRKLQLEIDVRQATLEILRRYEQDIKKIGSPSCMHIRGLGRQ